MSASATRKAVKLPPGLSSEADRKEAQALLAGGDAETRKKLVDLYFRAGRDVQHVICRRAENGSPELAEELAAASKAALGEADAGRKVVALQTLHRLKAKGAAADVAGLLSPDEPPEVTVAAIAYLGRMNCHEAFGEVLEQARSSRDARVRAAAIRNLALVGGRKHPEEAVPVLESALSSDDVRLQAEALRVLGRSPEHVSPAVRRRVKELAEAEAGSREETEVKEAARMLGEHLEALADMPHNTEGSR